MISYRANLVPIGVRVTERPKPVPPRPVKRIEPPASITDPLEHEIMRLIASSPLTWIELDAVADVGTGTVRQWFYRDKFTGTVHAVQALLAEFGYRLRLERITSCDEGRNW